jgi:hypothetical protein
MKNLLKSFRKNIFINLVLALAISISLASPLALAQNNDSPDADGFVNDNTIDVLKNFQEESGFRSFTNATEDGTVDQKGLDNLTGAISALTNILKWLVGGLALLFMVITLVKTIAASGDGVEEQLGKLKKHMVHIVTAFFVVFLLDFFVNNVFVITGGENFLGSRDDARFFAGIASGELKGIYRLVQAVTGTAAVAALVVSGVRLVANAGDEEVLNKAKNHIKWAAAGLILIAISEVLVQGFLFRDAGTTIDTQTGMQLIVQITNFASGFITMAAVVSFFYAGYLYVFSGVGEDNIDKVKKIITGALISILIAAGAFAVVNTVIELDPNPAPDILQNQVDRIQ